MVGGWKTLAVVLALGFLGWLIEAYKICASKQHLSAKTGFSLLDGLHVVRYLVMGWACVAVAGSMWTDLPREAVLLYAIGGVTYSIGVCFFVQHQMEFHLAIWHFAVLSASIMIYAANLQMVGVPLP